MRRTRLRAGAFASTAVALLAVVAATLAPPTPATAGSAAAPTATTAAAEPVSLGTPLTDTLLLGGTVTAGPNGEDALWSTSTGTPAYLNAIDPASGEQLVSAPLPGASGAWAVTHAPDGSVYAGSYENGHLYRWRPGAGNTVEDLGAVPAGQTFVHRLVSDENGRIYGGTTPGGRVFAYDPATDEFTDHGQILTGQTYVSSIAYADGALYTGSYAETHLVRLDIATGEKTELPLPPNLGDPKGKAVYDLRAIDGRLYARIGSAFPSPLYVYDLSLGTWVDEIPDAHGLDVSPAGADGEIYLIQASELKRYDPATKKLTGTGLKFSGRVQNARGIGWAELGLPDYPGRSIVGMLWRGDSFRYSPTTGKFEIIPTKIRREPTGIIALHAGASGSLYAGGFLNGGLAAVDPDDGTPAYNRFSQVESVLEVGEDEVWIGAYPDARVYRYDPTKPWSSSEYSPGPEGTPENPVQALLLKPHVQMRARALTAVDGKIAVGTIPEGDNLGGALAIHDPATGETDVMRNVVRDESVFALTAKGPIVYGATSITGGLGTTPPTRTEGTIFAWDTRSGRKLWEVVPVPKAGTVSAVALGPDGRLWGVAGDTVFAFDLKRRKVTRTLKLGDGTDLGNGELVADRKNGVLYAALNGHQVFEVSPSGSARKILDHDLYRMVLHPNGRLYFNDDAELFSFHPPRRK